MRIRCLILIAALLGVAAAGAQEPSAKKADDWIRLLGSPRYQDRERASRELDSLGDAAFPTLKEVARSAEPEVRKRAEDLLQKIEDRLTRAKLLAPKVVRIQATDMPILDAIAELSKASSIPIQFQGDRTVLATRKITFDTGETTFWKAFDSLCLKGGLIEPSVPAAVGRQRTVYFNGMPPPTAQQPLQVTNGDPSTHRFAYFGAVRIRIVPMPQPKGSGGAITYAVSVAAEPRIDSFQETHEPLIDRATDEQGQDLRTASAAAPRGVDDAEWMMMQQMQQMTRGSSSIVQLQPAAKKSEKLTYLKGTIGVSMRVAEKELAVVKQVSNNIGVAAKGTDGSALTLLSLEKIGDSYRARIRVESTQANPFGGFAGGGRIMIQGNVIINGVAQRGVSSAPILADAQGRPYIAGPIMQNSMSINNGSVASEFTLTYRGADLGPPETLTLSGTRQVALPLTFEFRDVPVR